MAQFEELKNAYKNAQETFKKGLDNLRLDFQENQEKETARISLDDGYLNKQTSDFSLNYCLSETMEQLERAMKEKPSRELSLVKTKLQEASYWASQA